MRAPVSLSLAILCLALLSPNLAAGTLIAPVEPHYGETSSPDVNPDAATNGTTTLVAWTNESSPYIDTHDVYVRLLGAAQRGSIRVGRGFSPKVAWNGTEYLVAYGIAGSRFSSYPFPNVAVTMVHADGSLGPTRFIHTSVSAGTSGIAWNGREWMAGVYDGSGRIVFLNRFLEVARPPIEIGNAPVHFVEIKGTWWGVKAAAEGSEVFEIDGGRRFTVAGKATMSGRLAVIANGTNLSTATFDPRTGFSAPKLQFPNARLLDFDDGRIAFQKDGIVRAVTLDAYGNVSGSTVLYEEQYATSLSFIRDSILVSLRRVTTPGTGKDIYQFPFRLEALDPSEGTLVSASDRIVQYFPRIASTGTHAVAFWNQTTADGRTVTLSRNIDANGLPFGAITQLPFVFWQDVDIAFDGEQFLFVWSDGQIFASNGGAPSALGRGSRPAVASGPHGTFVVWESNGTIMGTPFPAAVPGGFPILPSFSSGQGAPAITSVEDGFVVLWTAEHIVSTVISPAGTPRSSSKLSNAQADPILIEGRLAAWREGATSTLFGYGDKGRPFDRFDPRWGKWTPLAIHPLGGQRYHVAFQRPGGVFTAVITMNGAFITDITPPELLTNLSISHDGITVVREKAIAVFARNGRVEVTTKPEPTRRRAVR